MSATSSAKNKRRSSRGRPKNSTKASPKKKGAVGKLVAPEPFDDSLSPLTDLANKEYTLEASPRQGRHAMAFIARASKKKSQDLFVKKQLILSPDNVNDKAYREAQVMQQIEWLRETGKCFNFVDVLKQGVSEGHMISVMPLADKTLKGCALTLPQVRAVLFQILYALAVGQHYLEFVHHDLHLDNVLVYWSEEAEQPAPVNSITTRNGVHYFGDPLVKLTDYGLSRIKTREGEEIYNKKNPVSGAFDTSLDISNLADGLKTQIKIVDKSECDSEDLQQYRRVIFAMGKQRNSPEQILEMEFFDDLRKPVGEVTGLTAVGLMETGADLADETPPNTPTRRSSPRLKGKTRVVHLFSPEPLE